MALDIDITENEIKRLLFSAIDNYDSICVNPYHIPIIRDLSKMRVTCPIDYPYGVSKVGLRNNASLTAIRAGACSLDLMIPHGMFFNKKYDDFVLDIHSHQKMCEDNNVELRLILEHSKYSREDLSNLFSIVRELRFETVILGTGIFNDDFTDSLITAYEVKTKFKVEPIITQRFCTAKELQLAAENGVLGIRTKSILV